MSGGLANRREEGLAVRSALFFFYKERQLMIGHVLEMILHYTRGGKSKRREPYKRIRDVELIESQKLFKFILQS